MTCHVMTPGRKPFHRKRPARGPVADAVCGRRGPRSGDNTGSRPSRHADRPATTTRRRHCRHARRRQGRDRPPTARRFRVDDARGGSILIARHDGKPPQGHVRDACHRTARPHAGRRSTAVNRVSYSWQLIAGSRSTGRTHGRDPKARMRRSKRADRSARTDSADDTGQKSLHVRVQEIPHWRILHRTLRIRAQTKESSPSAR